MTTDPIPFVREMEIGANQTSRLRLKGTNSLFVQTIIFDCDNGDLHILNVNFCKFAIVREMGTAFTTLRDYFTLQNQKIFDFYRGIVLRDDIEFTVTENGGEDTVFQVTVIPARRSAYPFVDKTFRESRAAGAVTPPPPEF